MAKYNLIATDLIAPDGSPLFRVVAAEDFIIGSLYANGFSVRAGEEGGLVAGYHNLSMNSEKTAWIKKGAMVYENACILDNALISDNAKVYGHAEVGGNARVCQNAEVFENAHVWDNAHIEGAAKVYGNAAIFGDTCVLDSAQVFENAYVTGDTELRGNSILSGNTSVRDLFLADNAEVTQRVYLHGADATFRGNACIKSCMDYFIALSCCGDNTILSFFREKDGQIRVCCTNGRNGRDGCWPLEEFVKCIPTLYKGKEEVQKILHHTVSIAKLHINGKDG